MQNPRVRRPVPAPRPNRLRRRPALVQGPRRLEQYSALEAAAAPIAADSTYSTLRSLPGSLNGPDLLAAGRQRADDLARLYVKALFDPWNAPPGARPDLTDPVSVATQTFYASFPLNATTLVSGEQRLAFSVSPGFEEPVLLAQFNTTTGDITGWTSLGTHPAKAFVTANFSGWAAAGFGAKIESTGPLLDTSGRVLITRNNTTQYGALTWNWAGWSASPYATTRTLVDMLRPENQQLNWVPPSSTDSNEMKSPSGTTPYGRLYFFGSFPQSSTTTSLIVPTVGHYALMPLSTSASLAVTVGAPNPRLIADVTDAVAEAVPVEGSPGFAYQIARAVDSIVGVVKEVSPVFRKVATLASSGYEFVKGLLTEDHGLTIHDDTPLSVYRAWADAGFVYPPPLTLTLDAARPGVMRTLRSDPLGLSAEDWSRGLYDAALLGVREMRTQYGRTLVESGYWRRLDSVLNRAVGPSAAGRARAFVATLQLGSFRPDPVAPPPPDVDPPAPLPAATTPPPSPAEWVAVAPASPPVVDYRDRAFRARVEAVDPISGLALFPRR